MGTTQIEHDIGGWQDAALTIARPLFKFLWRIDVQGLEHLPTDGPAILCPNHVSVIDSFVLPAVLPRGITYVGKAEYLDDWKTATLFPKLGMIPIDRRGGDHAAAALDAARDVLLGGGLFGIYPEGTRSRSGKLHKGRTGAARLSIETGAPIVPVGLKGTLEIQPPDQAMPRPFRRASVTLGEPIDPGRYRARSGDRAVYRRLTDEVMFEIQALTGQEYEHTYAGSSTPSAPAPDTTSDTESTPTPRRAPSINEAVVVDRRSSTDVLTSRPLVSA